MRRSTHVLILALVPVCMAQDVPLARWTSPTWPSGLSIGASAGISWGDYDADGWVDFFSPRSGQLWHNLAGRDWEMFEIIEPGHGYGCSFGDYDNDGWPDIATEPRLHLSKGLELKLLRNQGSGPFFVDVAATAIDVPIIGNTETNCWADVDFDGDLDLFVPAYPPVSNFFLENLGPVGPNGEYELSETSAQAGLEIPKKASRPEGAEFADVDGDGDVDLYSNGTLYANQSSHGSPRFVAMNKKASGILHKAVLDEGCTFFDHDLDGDLDLVLVFHDAEFGGARIYENQGDGTFQRLPEDIFDPQNPYLIGVSKADWDNDGDIDLTLEKGFFRNLLVETGEGRYVRGSLQTPGKPLWALEVAWADFDRDGDLDCCASEHWGPGILFENTLYGRSTPAAERRYVRVRVVRDDDDVPRGLETEYGAVVELFPIGDDGRFRRRNFVSSSGGYVNQNEYGLHFALPDDPHPLDPDEDLRFDVQVDFPSDPSVGLRRIDRHVNPALGRVHLTQLTDREIVVYRSGRVSIDGRSFEPAPGKSAVLRTTTGGLALAANGRPLPDPVLAHGTESYVGLDFDTVLADRPLRVKEVILDGVVAKIPARCGGLDLRITLWDVTDSSAPFAVEASDLVPRVHNHRNAYRFDALLQPGRHYRVVAHVDLLRASPVPLPALDGPVTVHGGLSFEDPSPCEGTATTAAILDTARVPLAIRFTEDA